METSDDSKSFYLIGEALREIEESSSPTLRRLLQNVLFEIHTNHQKTRRSIELVIERYTPIWRKFQVEIKIFTRLCDRLENEYNNWCKVKKNKLSTTVKQKLFREAFVERLDMKFDARRISKSEEKKDVETLVPEMMDIVEYDQPEASTSEGTSSNERPEKIKAKEKIKEHAEHKRPRLESEFGGIIYYYILSTNVSLIFFTFNLNK